MADHDPSPPPRRARPLLAAAGIPVLALLVILTAVAVQHRGATPQPRPTPLSLQPSAPPTPTTFPSLVEPDDFTLSAPQGFGAISPPPASSIPNLTIAIALASTRIDLPAQLPVWRLAEPRPTPSATAVAARFGIHRTPDSADQDTLVWREGLVVDTRHLAISWLAAPGVENPHLGGIPRDTGSALQLATQWLTHAGLAPDATEPVTVVQTSSGDSASFAEWRVTWERSAPGYAQWPVDTTSLRVSADGTLKELHASRPPVAGGSMYRLRPWQDALRDAQAGRWFQLCCQPLPEPANPYTLHVTIRDLTLAYAVVDTAQGAFAVPMYAFRERDGDTPGLVAALAP